MENTQSYTSSLSERYPSKEMKYLFSPEMKFRTWQKTLDRTGRNGAGAGPSHH